MSWISAGVALVGIGTKVYTGIKQKQEAKKLQVGNQFTDLTIPNELLENQRIARNEADEGLPSEQYKMAQQNIQRQQAAALRSAGDRRSALGLIGSVQQNSNDAQGKLDVANAMARLQNRKALMLANNQVANYETNIWNQRNANRNQQYQYSMGLLGAGNANIASGIDSATAALLQYGGGLFGGRYAGNVVGAPASNSYRGIRPVSNEYGVGNNYMNTPINPSVLNFE